MTPEQARVLAHLLAYRNKPHTLAAIAQSVRLPRRTVEDCVQALRLAGQPLVSGDAGIRYSTDAKEVEACSEALRRRLRSQYATLRALRATAKRMQGVSQPSLWDAAA